MSASPFDPQTIFLAKHAQHVVLIHFPIALFLTGVFFDFAARWTKNPALATAAYFDFLFAAISTIPAVATGLLAWLWALDGQKLKGILLLHLILACLSTVLIWSVWLLHRRGRRVGSISGSRFLLGLESLAVMIIAMTGHLGGLLSGVNLPN